MSKNQLDPTEIGEKYLMDILRSDDPKFLRSMTLEMIILVSTIYRRLQLHMMLHPLFFLGGFLTCYFFLK
jgi:hypothetical protein|tara:strand:+ start:483 stop:692 length:210 start_codon:yes stop_codon:yes gene_type:complete